MTPQEAIAALKAGTCDRTKNYTNLTLSTADYHALLALLDGLRWRSVVEEKPPGDARLLVIRKHTGAAMFFWSSENSMSWLSAEGLWSIDDDDLWLPLSSILPGDA